MDGEGHAVPALVHRVEGRLVETDGVEQATEGLSQMQRNIANLTTAAAAIMYSSQGCVNLTRTAGIHIRGIQFNF